MSKSLIAVDVGNSFLHVARYSLDERDEFGMPQLTTRSALSVIKTSAADETLLKQLRDTSDPWFVVSVNRQREAQLAALIQKFGGAQSYRLLAVGDFDLKMDVEFPHRVGTDRIAAALAAYQMRGESQTVIVIDAGTAVTVDRVDSPGIFRGGAIFPGHYLLADSLHRHTDALPLVTPPSQPPCAVGKNTEEAIRSGLFWGSLGAMRELITRARGDLGVPPKLFFTGGANQQALAELLEATSVSDLVLRGVASAGARILGR